MLRIARDWRTILAVSATCNAFVVSQSSFPAKKGEAMPKYVIERNMPGAGSLSREQLAAASRTSCGVLNELGPRIQWVESYVTGDKIYCIYVAPNKQLIEEHAKRGGFPANRIEEIKAVIDPTTAEQSP